jgi:hypothetical protein
MLGLIKLIFGLVLDLFRSRAALEAEILVLRQQIILLRRGRVGAVDWRRCRGRVSVRPSRTNLRYFIRLGARFTHH